MRLIIDGFSEEVSEGLSVAELVLQRGEDSVDLIVEVNHRYVHRGDYSKTILQDGDKIEIIHPAFGG